MLRKYIEREDEQQTSKVQVWSVDILDDSSESLYEDMKSLVESPSVLDCGEVNDITINRFDSFATHTGKRDYL